MPGNEKIHGNEADAERAFSSKELFTQNEREHKNEHDTPKPEKLDQERREARSEALEHAKERQSYNDTDSQPLHAERRHNASRHSANEGFRKTMARVQADMPLPQRAFSKFIHNSAVEKTSDVIGSTLARPSSILSGSLSALIFTATLYFTARYFGFSLSGFETIGAFIVGWVAGFMFDLLRRLVKR